MESSESHHKKEFGVLPAYEGGGPKGLGDPNDRSIRKLENELVLQMMREESKKLCVEENKAFGECLKGGGFFFFIRCYPTSQELKRCQLRWFHNEEFEERIRNKYLDERAEYRRTGITGAQKKEFQKWLKQKEEEKARSQTS